MTTKTLTRWIPTGYELAKELPELDLAVYYTQHNNGFYAIGYKGKATKPSFHFRFKTIESMNAHTEKFINDAKQSQEIRAKRKEENKPTNKNIKIGDIFRASWGYDQTNVDYYQVVALVGKASVKVREITSERVNDGVMSGQCVPAINQFCGDEFIAQVRNNSIKIGHHYARLKEYTLIAGVKVYNADYWSSYA